MKIAICGKGGCGKSTTVALLALALSSKGKEVLVVDSDESNYGLHRQLGMELPRDFTEFFGGKQKILNNIMLSNFSHKFFSETWTLSDIPDTVQGKTALHLWQAAKSTQLTRAAPAQWVL